VFQTYAAYTPFLDDLNAESLRDHHGPDAVIRQTWLSIGRLPPWESPDYMVALTCNFAITGETTGWQVLERTTDACGVPSPLAAAVARSGQTLRTPAARHPDDIIVATFDYPISAVERWTTALLKPSHLPSVLTNGAPSELAPGTAAQFHLIRVPVTIGKRRIANGGFDVQDLAFPNAQHPVTVHFFDVATNQMAT
jgi:hypothetical protein